MLFRKKQRGNPAMRNSRPSAPQQGAPKANTPSTTGNNAFSQNAQHTVTKENTMMKKQNIAAKAQHPASQQAQKMSPKPAAVPSSVARRANIPGYGNPHKTMAPRDIRDSRKLIVGREISLNGEINTCDHLVVEGTVKATIKGGEMLEVAHRGLFQGKVEIQEATIAGTYEGDLKVLDRLYVKSTGIIKGSIEYGEMEVESGARIDGQIVSMGGTASKNQTHANDEQEPENSDTAEDGDYESAEDKQLALA